ncbi:MAG: phage integrase N-terminal SAM-like domain-containing protein [Chitinophagales bacterium]|nr:phage integrase N-terminal SAM-like domain-containing protein [Chitinophagales bacterium]
MEGRSTVYNKITSEEKIKQINPENTQLSKDFLDYLASIDRSPKTIFAYNSDLEIFFVWNLEENANKEFIKISKRDFARFQNHALNVWKWSPRRIRRVKSTLSSQRC